MDTEWVRGLAECPFSPRLLVPPPALFSLLLNLSPARFLVRRSLRNRGALVIIPLLPSPCCRRLFLYLLGLTCVGHRSPQGHQR